MKYLSELVLILCVAVSWSAAEKFSFQGYRFVKLTPKSENHLSLLALWENNPEVTEQKLKLTLS